MRLKPLKNTHNGTSTYIHSCLVSLLLAIMSPQLAADDYLDSIRDEAGKLEYLDETRSSNTITTSKQTTNPEIRQALQSINHFEKYFKTHDSASSIIYLKLTTQERLRIYHRFKATRSFEIAQKMTIELYNKKR